ncbi:MAG: hypothetical protein RR784_06535, partial [Burkholderiaceae bacterium]
ETSGKPWQSAPRGAPADRSRASRLRRDSWGQGRTPEPVATGLTLKDETGGMGVGHAPGRS